MPCDHTLQGRGVPSLSGKYMRPLALKKLISKASASVEVYTFKKTKTKPKVIPILELDSKLENSEVWELLFHFVCFGETTVLKEAQENQ